MSSVFLIKMLPPFIVLRLVWLSARITHPNPKGEGFSQSTSWQLFHSFPVRLSHPLDPKVPNAKPLFLHHDCPPAIHPAEIDAQASPRSIRTLKCESPHKPSIGISLTAKFIHGPSPHLRPSQLLSQRPAQTCCTPDSGQYSRI